MRSVIPCAKLVVMLLATRLHTLDPSSTPLGIALAALCVVLFFFSRFLLELREQQRQTASALDTTEISLLESEERFRQMADNMKTMDGSLNPHKNRQGYPCYGRYGVYVRTKY